MGRSTRRDRTRREFIADGARLAAGAAGLAAGACFPDVGGRWPAELDGCHSAAPAPVAGSGRVVEVYDAQSVAGEPATTIQPDVVAAMLERALAALAGSDDFWPLLLPGVDASTRVGLKVNCLNQEVPTSLPVVRAVIASLRARLGLDGDHLVVWDRRYDELERSGFTRDALGVQVLGTVASTTDASGPGYEIDHCTIAPGKTARLSRIVTRLTDVTINVPVLKTHGVSGVTAALKNAYGAIDNPGDFHRDVNAVLPAIYALPPIRDRFKLTVCDALIAITVGGTSSPADTVARRLLVASDPLALDRRALELADELRAARDPPLGPVDRSITGWLDQGHTLGLGAREVELVQLA
ncbi:MAG: DUF362 domain-containing protein [Deltaproteobacteria bacterium]|nr:DUF362 domain-containing protein [Deltaproteobacteria bacterium]